MGPPVFKTGEAARAAWRVRFPSASAELLDRGEPRLLTPVDGNVIGALTGEALVPKREIPPGAPMEVQLSCSASPMMMPSGPRRKQTR